jgi:hypothetical protein
MKLSKKIITLLTAASIFTTVLAVPSFAATLTDTKSGSVALVDDGSQVTPFSSASVSVGGGTWVYGTETIANQKHVWSTYYNDTKIHKSSVQLGSATNTSGWVAAGAVASSELYGNTSYTGYAFWGVQ